MELDFPLQPGYQWQYDVIVWTQSWTNPWLDHVMKWLTYIGVDRVYLILLPLFFWTINKRAGMRIMYVFLLSMYVNTWLKATLQMIRPSGISGIQTRMLFTAPGYSMPSAHAQGSATFWLLLSRYFKREWFRVLAWVLLLGIGISRVYFGLHWPMDVFVGWALGVLFAHFGWKISLRFAERGYSQSAQMVFAIAVPVLLFAIRQDSASAEVAALLFAVGLGAVLEGRYLHLQMGRAWWQRVFAGIIGIAGMIAIQWVLSVYTSQVAWLIVRDLLLGLWTTLGAPYVFQLCGLYQRAGTS